MTRFRSTIPSLLAMTLLPAILPGAALDLPPSSLESIDPGWIRQHVEFLASRELGGRYTLSPGLGITNRYLASRLEYLGYKGGNGGDFLQPFEVETARADQDQSSLSLTISGQKLDFKYGDFLLGDGPGGELGGEVVFAGYGISASKHDDYAGLEVEGKLVLVFPGTPDGIDGSRLKEDQKGPGAAQRHGAIGLLKLPDPRFARYLKSEMFRKRLARRQEVDLHRPQEAGLNTIVLLPPAATPVLEQLGLDYDRVYDLIDEGHVFTPANPDISVQSRIVMSREIHDAANVAAILEGSDPQLRDEFVLIGAHQDHLKTNRQGKVFPGADDNASGVAAVLSVARALALSPPRRSVLIMFHSGEENGLLGSRYNTDVSPVVALEQIYVAINIDMVGRSRREGDDSSSNRLLTDANSVHVIGADRISPLLHQLNEETNRELEKLEFDYTLNDPSRPERIYYRSDHWNYAKKGIPIIFFFTGTHQDYHRATDTVDKIDFAKLSRIARHVYGISWRLANREGRLIGP